jgi:2-oxoglutarate dehydrogenase E1 component
MLRRQVLRRWRKPLVVMTPKSLLRHPGVASPLAEFTAGRFRPVLADDRVRDAERIVICSGKVYYDIEAERRRRQVEGVAIVRLEQLYPFPETELVEALADHPRAREVLFVQEEPGNMGALFYVQPRLARILGSRPLRTIKRSVSASPSTSSTKAHQMEQAALLAHVFSSYRAAAEPVVVR